MLTELFGRAIKPVNLHGRYSHPLYFSPSFAILSLASLVLFRWWTSIPRFESLLPAWVEWSILVVFLAIPMSLMAGLAPYAMVKLHERWGYASVLCTVLSLCLVFILSLWANPNKEVSLLPVFFQVAGVVGTLSLFLWPAMKLLGTPPDTSKEAREELAIHNAVAALLRRGEITMEEAVVANPWEESAPPLSIRLQNLPRQARWSIEREIEIERSIQENMRKSDSRRRRRIIRAG
jgi:hypothetical protein